MTLPTYMSGILFTRAHKVVRQHIYELLEKYELNPTYWSILSATVRADDGVRLARVADELGVKAPLVTMMASDLIEKGLISRIPHHTDRRAKLLVATAKGKKLAGIVEQELNIAIGELLAGLSTQEILAFQKTLETIIQNSGE
jgi:DNA-binding MarR family transcriptional regulator